MPVSSSRRPLFGALQLAALSACAAVQPALAAPSWVDAAPMLAARQELYPEVVDGRIYVAGGILNPNTSYSDSFDVYDPRWDRWTALQPLPEARHHVTLSHVRGRIYAIGGFSGGFPNWRAQSTMWTYDLARGRWSAGVDMPVPRAEGVAAVVDGKIYWIGGRVRLTEGAAHFNDHVDSNLNAMFDPGTGRWSPRANAPTARNSAAVGVIDGKIYVVGGRQFSRNETPGPIRQTNVTALEVYDPKTDRWETKAPMPAAQAGLGAAIVDGQLYTCGGEQLPTRLLPACWSYNPATDSWRSQPALRTPRHGIGMAAIGRRIHVFGGALTPGGNAATAMHEVLLVNGSRPASAGGE